MSTTVGPDYFDYVVESSVGSAWSDVSSTLGLDDYAYVQFQALDPPDTRRLSYYNWPGRTSIPTNATIDEITFRFRCRNNFNSPTYIPRLFPPGGGYTGVAIKITASTYTVLASALGMTNDERLRAVHATSTADATEYRVDVIDQPLGFGYETELYWITMEVEWSRGSGGGGGGILLAK